MTFRPHYLKDPIASGLIEFVAGDGDNFTNEKKTPAISYQKTYPLHPDTVFLLAIEKPDLSAAGDLTVNTYNVIKLDDIIEKDVLHTTHTVEQIEMANGGSICRDFLIQGLFVGEGKIKIGAKFASEPMRVIGEYKIYYKLYRL